MISMNKMVQFFKDKAGNLSSMRLILAIVVGTVIFVWAYLSLSAHAMSDIPTGVVTVVLVAITGKVVQTSIGEPLPKSPIAPTTEDVTDAVG